MEYPKRKRQRLPGFDYSARHYYYVTICTHQKRCLFWDNDRLNAFGSIAEQELCKIPAHFPDVQLDRYVVMPNHIHAIFVFGCTDTADQPGPMPTLSTVVGLYKSGVSKRIHQTAPGTPVWQKSFYDQIIRNPSAYREICNYILGNPLKWNDDELYIP